ncbi:MAG TPA: hypothetical protein VGV67_12985, partial [Solirubrobacteraceae bacterium]|nr:hypothetical protein [Solirubrobacteraceae bacterium]
MSRVNGALELEDELEEEMEYEYEDELEDEGEEFLGTLARGAAGALGLGEEEYEDELEGEYEDEYEGEFEDEYELEGEFEGEYEGEFEGEEFFRRLRGIARGVGRFARRAAPVLGRIARVAAPMVATAVGGPAAGMLARRVVGALGEEEGEFEGEFEGESEFEAEAEAEWMAAPSTLSQAQAELMAAQAATTQSEAEAEAMIGAATLASLTAADRRALNRVLPHMIRGTAVLTRVLRRNRATRPAVRAIPAVVQRSARTLVRQQQAQGRPITRRQAGRVMGRQVRRVIGRPRTVATAVAHNQSTARVAQRAARSAAPARVVRAA